MTDTKEWREDRDKMRRAVLDALDQWARVEFGRTHAGWQDQDLQNLFPALNAHFETCMTRFNISVEGEQTND